MKALPQDHLESVQLAMASFFRMKNTIPKTLSVQSKHLIEINMMELHQSWISPAKAQISALLKWCGIISTENQPMPKALECPSRSLDNYSLKKL